VQQLIGELAKLYDWEVGKEHEKEGKKGPPTSISLLFRLKVLQFLFKVLPIFPVIRVILRIT
jgi:hypothetical protein